MSYGILVTVRGVLPDEESKRLLTGGDGQPMAFSTLEQAEAAAARLTSVPGAEFKAVPLEGKVGEGENV
jgi:hypothetical protein